MKLSQKVNRLADAAFEVSLGITVTCTLNGKTAYLAEVEQAGVFGLAGFDEQVLDAMLGTQCPNILYPYATAAIGQLISSGGFPPFPMQPINFDALYAENLRQRAEQVAQQQGGRSSRTRKPPASAMIRPPCVNAGVEGLPGHPADWADDRQRTDATLALGRGAGRGLLGHRARGADRPPRASHHVVGPRCGDGPGDRRAPRESTLPARHCVAGKPARDQRAGRRHGRRRPGAGGGAFACLRRDHARAGALRPAHAGVAWATKGFEPGSGRFLHEVAGEVLGEEVPLAVVTGPSFAKEVAAGLPTALTVHSRRPRLLQAGRRRPAWPRIPRLHRRRHARRRAGRRDEECPRRRDRRGGRHGPGPERTRRPDHPRPQRNAAAQHRHWRPAGNPDGPGRDWATWC